MIQGYIGRGRGRSKGRAGARSPLDYYRKRKACRLMARASRRRNRS